MVQQVPAVAGILDSYNVLRFKRCDCTQADIIQISDRGCDNIEYAGHAKQCTLFACYENRPTPVSTLSN